MEAKQIKVVRKWLEPKLVRNIPVFLGFANFYRWFIQGFNRIAALLISILKINNKPAPSKNNGSMSALSRNNNRRPAFERNNGNSEVNGFGSDGVKYAKKSGKSKGQKISKSQNLAKFKKLSKSGNSLNFDAKNSGPSFLTPEARAAFNRLRLAFIKASILQYFDPECHIWIKIDALNYAIGAVLDQLTSRNIPDRVVTNADLIQWHSIAFFSRNMIPTETWYETHNGNLLANVKAFKMWCHYLEDCKYEIFVFTDHNNLRRFMDTKSLSSRQVRWAQELSQYHFQIYYC